MASDNTFHLKLKTKDKNFELKDEQLRADTSMAELRGKISQVTGIPKSLLRVLHGYPRKAIQFSDTVSIEKCDIKCGDTLLVEESATCSEEAAAVDSVPKSVPPAPSIRKQHVATDNSLREMRGIFLKKEVPSDNSCLFTSLGFVLSGTK